MAYMQFSRPEKSYSLSKKKNIMCKLFERLFPKEMIEYIKHFYAILRT